MCPFPSRFLNRDASFFDLCLYALWPRQFQSRDNFSSPAKTVRHASLCLYFGVWIIVSPLPPRFLKRDASSFDICFWCTVYGCCNFMRVLSLNWNYGMCSARYWRAGASQPSRTSGSDFSIYIYIYIYRYMGIYITGAAHTVIPI